MLIMPLSKEAHERRLRERGLYSESQIEWTLRRVDMYIQQNQLKPGFFDMMINSGQYIQLFLQNISLSVITYIQQNKLKPGFFDMMINSGQYIQCFLENKSFSNHMYISKTS